MKTTLEIPDALYRQVKMRAARDGVKVKDLVAKGLSSVLNEDPPTKPRKKKSIFPIFKGPLGPLLQGKDVRSLSFLDDLDDLERYQRSLRR
ncbi:MAG: hypothetical protein ABSH19_00510 [Opitutales bacterium]